MTFNLFPVPVEYIPKAVTDLEIFYLQKKIKEIKHIHHQTIKGNGFSTHNPHETCLLYTSDAADERSSQDLGGRRIIKKKK